MGVRKGWVQKRSYSMSFKTIESGCKNLRGEMRNETKYLLRADVRICEVRNSLLLDMLYTKVWWMWLVRRVDVE